MSPFELDRHVHRDLRRLPSPIAPPGFAARVVAAREKFDARPWYTRAWAAWPLEWQLMSGAALASIILLLGAVSPWVYGFVSDVVVRTMTEQAPGLRAGIVTVDAIWQAIVRPLALLLFPVVLLMSAACAACGVALTRLASGEVSRS